MSCSPAATANRKHSQHPLYTVHIAFSHDTHRLYAYSYLPTDPCAAQPHPGQDLLDTCQRNASTSPGTSRNLYLSRPKPEDASTATSLKVVNSVQLYTG